MMKKKLIDVPSENFCGLAESILQVCEFLNLKLPPDSDKKTGFMPSAYFGENFILSDDMKLKLRRHCKLTQERFDKIYSRVKNVYLLQKTLKFTETDLNIFFCDYLLFADKNGYDEKNYFNFEFYRKNLALRKTFLGDSDILRFDRICNDHGSLNFLDDKSVANEIFADFIHRDWLDTSKCSFADFENFVHKHKTFFRKPAEGHGGAGSKVIHVRSEKNLGKLFEKLQRKKFVLEEMISQHEIMKEFCPDTLNTIRINTLIDAHNAVNIVVASGRFGRIGKVVDNFSSGGLSVVVNPKTGEIISDGLNKFHERLTAHPDTGKIFKGFKYPFWEKICDTVRKMAKHIPQLRHVGWDIAINSNGDIEFVEGNRKPGVSVYQAPDSVGKAHLYKNLIDELENYKNAQMKFLGYKINNVKDFLSAYENNEDFEDGAEFAMKKLISSCKSLLDVGCRKNKFIKNLCSKNVEYCPIELNKNFSDKKADTCICVMTAEYVRNLPKFFESICNAANKQILILCRPIDKEKNLRKRWENLFVADFTEEFLIKSMQKNKFRLHALDVSPKKNSVILYDFRAEKI